MRAVLLAAAGVAAMAAGSAGAETLRQALDRTYETNPTIMAERERLRALDESVAIARAAGRPQVSATVGVNQDLFNTNSGEGRNFSAGVDVSYPLFNGGRVRNSVRACSTP